MKASKSLNSLNKFDEEIRSRGPYNKIPIETKKKAVSLSRKLKDPLAVSKMLSIPLKSLKRWIKNGCLRKPSGWRTQDPEMENQLTNWIIDFHWLNSTMPNASVIKKMALQFSNYPDKFKASKGWYEKFVLRFKDFKSDNNINK